MKTRPDFRNAFASLLTILIVAGCASTKETNYQQLTTGPLPRPNQIWIYDFAASPADVPPQSALAGQSQYGGPQTPDQLAQGRQLGAEIAGQLVQQINAMGMPAAIASGGTRPQLNDIVIEGSILSVQTGNAAERVTIGFAAGDTELKVAVEGFHMTAGGLREIGSADLSAKGAETPGAGFGLATMLATHNPAGFIVSTGMKAYGEESGSDTIQGRAKQIAKQIADQLKTRFQQQGWI
jgi:Domain of unknown function (DUF4410)